ncbi:L-asparaginase II [Phytomonospora endophytica]|uniref:L-asparaginase II n=1 Tax=Phytomonospora endophytica TaxID=714109 RepID=A0A841FZ13_9ACTN|nr:L-asparaginase II [Phytomonospora endophytica]GIG67938.1 asparaginase [Phytomonospora endophytica]
MVYKGGAAIAEVVRSGFVEGLHRGSIALLDARGDIAYAAGDIDGPVFPRSANKPLQAVGMLRAGLPLPAPADLAIAAASHWGEPFHIARVRRILVNAGLTESDLACPRDLPVDSAARAAVIASGGGATRLLMNCSGKHATMLATCVAAGWSTSDYLDPGHPLQKEIARTIADLVGEPIAATGVDGCGAPLFAFSLTALARSFAALVSAEPGSNERAVADAMRANPEQVAGTRGHDTRFMRAVPGMLSKVGAEGVWAMAVPGVGALAVKIDDGARRAALPVAVAGLARLGVTGDELAKAGEAILYGRGVPVGAVRATLP